MLLRKGSPWSFWLFPWRCGKTRVGMESYSCWTNEHCSPLNFNLRCLYVYHTCTRGLWSSRSRSCVARTLFTRLSTSSRHHTHVTASCCVDTSLASSLWHDNNLCWYVRISFVVKYTLSTLSEFDMHCKTRRVELKQLYFLSVYVKVLFRSPNFRSFPN